VYCWYDVGFGETRFASDFIEGEASLSLVFSSAETGDVRLVEKDPVVVDVA
jgi:hypothetical protein